MTTLDDIQRVAAVLERPGIGYQRRLGRTPRAIAPRSGEAARQLGVFASRIEALSIEELRELYDETFRGAELSSVGALASTLVRRRPIALERARRSMRSPRHSIASTPIATLSRTPSARCAACCWLAPARGVSSAPSHERTDVVRATRFPAVANATTRLLRRRAHLPGRRARRPRTQAGPPRRVRLPPTSARARPLDHPRLDIGLDPRRLYIVSPLALGVSLRATGLDRAACGAFWLGTLGMVAGFWTGRYGIVAAASVCVLVPFATIGTSLARGLRRARVPAGVTLHVVLAFANVLAAGSGGLVLALNRLTGSLPWSPSLAAAHAHLAVLGWATMMILGVAYRLIPMFVPAAMPAGRGLGASAVLLEVGTIGLTCSLVFEASPMPWVVFVLAALFSFFLHVRRIVRERRPRPVELPRHDWATWQTHAAMLYLLVAAVLGLRLAAGGADPGLAWAYGVTGILGFVAQMVLGIEGRLLPMYAWYRSLERADGRLPDRSVHRLIVPSLSLAVLVCWLVGVPLLTFGLVSRHHLSVAGGSAALLAGTLANAAYTGVLTRRALARNDQ
jgi:hypothetical protein